MDLTDAQEQAVRYSGRNLQLIACAGSGKTEVVAQRVVHLLTKHGGKKLEPRNIVAFTFTDKAAAELKERILRRMREAAGYDLTGMAEMHVGTIHGFCQKLLQDEVPEYRKYEVLEPIRQALYVDRKSSKTGLTKSSKLNGTRLSLNPPKEGVALASWSGKKVLLRFWDNGLEQKTGPRKGAPNRCYHATTPTVFVSPSTTAAWWPMPGCSFPPPWPRHLGLPELVRQRLDLGDAPGRANTGDKMMTLVASALAGGDCIDDADVLRTGGTACTLGGTVKAPSTLGTFPCAASVGATSVNWTG